MLVTISWGAGISLGSHFSSVVGHFFSSVVGRFFSDVVVGLFDGKFTVFEGFSGFGVLFEGDFEFFPHCVIFVAGDPVFGHVFGVLVDPAAIFLSRQFVVTVFAPV